MIHVFRAKRRCGGSGVSWRPKNVFLKSQQGRESLGVLCRKLPFPQSLAGKATQGNVVWLCPDASCRDGSESPYGRQSLLLKGDQNNPWEQVDGELMNAIFSFQLCRGRN